MERFRFFLCISNRNIFLCVSHVKRAVLVLSASMTDGCYLMEIRIIELIPVQKGSLGLHLFDNRAEDWPQSVLSQAAAYIFAPGEMVDLNLLVL